MSRKYVDIKEFQEAGWVHEINRLFLHPVGMALEVKVDDAGVYSLNGIWDERDDPEGIQYQEVNQDKVKKVWDTLCERHPKRQEKLGYVIQMT
jgi:hypothetical protein